MSEHDISWTAHNIDTVVQLCCALENRSRNSWRNWVNMNQPNKTVYDINTEVQCIRVPLISFLVCLKITDIISLIRVVVFFLITLSVLSVLCSWCTVRQKQKLWIDALSSNLKTNSLIKVQMETLSCVYKTNITGVQNRVKTAEAKSSGKLP